LISAGDVQEDAKSLGAAGELVNSMAEDVEIVMTPAELAAEEAKEKAEKKAKLAEAKKI
jgi:hypothetical protein